MGEERVRGDERREFYVCRPHRFLQSASREVGEKWHTSVDVRAPPFQISLG